MNDIYWIYDMLDWHAPLELQKKGIELAKKHPDIRPFLQPLEMEYNKNIWDNCAVVISSKSDEELEPYFTELLEWLQDMNWPGSFYILERLKKVKNNKAMCRAFALCQWRAKEQSNAVWLENLSELGYK